MSSSRRGGLMSPASSKKVKKRSSPYERVGWRGVTLDARTASAMDWVAARVKNYVRPAQGSWSGADASAGTHSGSSAIDVGVAGWSLREIQELTNVMRRAGFAAWYRPPAAATGNFPGWGPHVHAILIGGKMMSPQAAAQVVAYKNGRNGLANNAYDYSWRPRIPRRWSHRLRRPVLQPLPGQKLRPNQKKLLPESRPR